MTLYFQGLTYDHVELNFFLNGKPLGCPMMGIKGTIYPIFYGKHALSPSFQGNKVIQMTTDKSCFKQPHKKKTKNRFSRLVFA